MQTTVNKRQVCIFLSIFVFLDFSCLDLQILGSTSIDINY